VPRFDFAISFAGSERGLARELAGRLAGAGLRVFFDEHFEHEMLGIDGADYLNRVFFEQSRYCVALVSQSYESRAWTQLERRAAQAREQSFDHGVLIPVLVDETRPSWLLPTRVYFNLADRSLAELTDVLQKKHTSEDRTVYREIQRIELPERARDISIISGWGDDDFLIWRGRTDEHEPQAYWLAPQDTPLEWRAHELPFIGPTVQWLVRSSGGTLVGIPEAWVPTITIYHHSSGNVENVRPNRPYRWSSITSYAERDGSILLGYCGGDVWHLDTSTCVMRELRSGTNDVHYTYVDFWKERFVVGLEEHCEVEIRRISDGEMISRIDSPIAIEGLFCFEQADLVAVAGLDAVATISLSTGRVVATEEVARDRPSGSRIVERALAGFISEFPWTYDTVEVLDKRDRRRVIRRRSIGENMWSSIALSSSGTCVAIINDNNVTIFSRDA
jgi:hypothetical protein